MPQPKLLRQPSRILNSGQQQYLDKINSELERPAKKPKASIWHNPVVRSILTNGLVLGMGVVLTLGVQRIQQQQQHRLRHDA